MPQPDIPRALCRADAYPHPCSSVRLIETHISWVFLTGSFAYKVKKPVAFGFVDFSTAEAREHFCREELRCNRPFAPELYVDVVPIVHGPQGGLRVAAAGAGTRDAVVEWAVKMVQFDTTRQLDNLLAANLLLPEQLHDFGRVLADQHARLPRLEAMPGDAARRVQQPVLDNFRSLDQQPSTAQMRGRLRVLEAAAQSAFERLEPVFEQRLAGGRIRECHGDLHLSNLVLTDRGVRAFDCLEFNANLRWIDIMSDAAFLMMDCSVRRRDDLAYAFLDGYLDRSADYAGARLLAYFGAYRSMVRAKVAALQLATATAAEGLRAELEQKLERHVAWTEERLARPPGTLVVMCGVSGSGKSYLAQRLAPLLPALRLRSDVARKALAGIHPNERSESGQDAGLYRPSATDAVYAELAEHAANLLTEGEHVIIDATCGTRARRAEFEALARRLGAPCRVVWCDAPLAVLQQRVEQRLAGGTDPSEADLSVLAEQRQRFEPPDANERVLRVDTSQSLDPAAIAARCRSARDSA